MIMISVFRAQDSYEGNNVESFRIETADAIPERDNFGVFERDAEAIVEAFWKSLPGGTVDRILLLMLQRRASQLVVPMRAFEADVDTIPPGPSTD